MDCGNRGCDNYSEEESYNCELSSTGANLNEECGNWVPDLDDEKDISTPQTMILHRLSEAAQIAHLEFMKKGMDGHQDEEWWRELSLEIEEIINNYL
jgi:hypothetical protein